MKNLAKTELNNPLRAMSIRVVLLGLAFIVALVSCVLVTVAWYTKMVSVSGLEFKTAEWDFTANYAVEGIAVNVYEYSNVNGPDLAAPGTKGYIPVKLSAWQSDTDVSFTLLLDRKSMSQEFQKRIFFYYCTDGDGNIVDRETANKVYLGGKPKDSDVSGELMEGTITRGESETVYIFWEWLYEDPDHTKNSEEWIIWNTFDTSVGKNPGLYVDEMNAKITVAGVQVVPDETNTTIK